MSKEKMRFPIRRKITLMVFVIALSLSAILIVTSYTHYRTEMFEHYENFAMNIGAVAASQIDPDRIQGYLETGVRDEEYERTFSILCDIRENGGVEYLYVVKPEEEEVWYLMDTDPSEDAIPLGFHEPYYEGAFRENAQRMARGERIDPLISDEEFGAALKRGHVDVNVTYLNLRQDARQVRVDEGLARQYRDAMLLMRGTLFEVGVNISDEMRHLSDHDVSFIASQPDVLQVTVAEEDQEAVLSLLTEALALALEDVAAMREKEGAALRDDLSFHLGEVRRLRDEINLLAPKVPVIYRDKLQARLRELGVKELDEQRLAQEAAIMADRCAIDEELSRLLSHIGQMRQAIEAEGETGRRLDFLTQELNREVNTIGSKASDAEITKLVVAAKSEIEKLREQVQNVE